MSAASFAPVPPGLGSFDRAGVAVVFGASGGIGSALLALVAGSEHFSATMGFGRRSAIPIDLTDEASLSRAVDAPRRRPARSGSRSMRPGSSTMPGAGRRSPDPSSMPAASPMPSRSMRSARLC